MSDVTHMFLGITMSQLQASAVCLPIEAEVHQQHCRQALLPQPAEQLTDGQPYAPSMTKVKSPLHSLIRSPQNNEINHFQRVDEFACYRPRSDSEQA
jgi:hypothetical protein